MQELLLLPPRSLATFRFHSNIWDEMHFEFILQKNKMHKCYEMLMLEEAKIYLCFPYGESLLYIACKCWAAFRSVLCLKLGKICKI